MLKIEKPRVISAPLAALDAQLGAICHEKERYFLKHDRHEIVPNYLITYSFSGRRYLTGGRKVDYGEIRLQFIDEKTTRLQAESHGPTEDEIIGSGDYPKWLAKIVNFFFRVDINDVEGRTVHDEQQLKDFTQEFLAMLDERVKLLNALVIETVSAVEKDLPRTANVSANDSLEKQLPKKSLSGSHINRVALVLLEDKLRKKDFSLTRQRIVGKINDILDIHIKEHTLRNAKNFYIEVKAGKVENYKELLKQAEQKADEWFIQFQ